MPLRSEKRTLLGSPRPTEIAGRAHSQGTQTAAPGPGRSGPLTGPGGGCNQTILVSEFVRPAVWPPELVGFIASPPFYSRKKGRGGRREREEERLLDELKHKITFGWDSL